MPGIVYIYRERDGFTLFDENGGRMEVDHGLVPEKVALEMFSDLYACRDFKTVLIEDAGTDALFEGIGEIAVCRNGAVEKRSVGDIFAAAVDVLLKEVDEQEKVAGYFNVLSGNIPGLGDKFRKFFVTQLKATREAPREYCFPEYSCLNPSLASAARTGGEGREWGVIRDKKNLEEIGSKIRSSLSAGFGDIPERRFADNYFLTH